MTRFLTIFLGILVLTVLLTACGSDESKIQGVWKLQTDNPDMDTVYLEFTEERVILTNLDDETISANYIFTSLESKNFLLEIDESISQLLFEGNFKNIKTIEVIPNESAQFNSDYEDSDVEFVKIKDLEKDKEEELAIQEKKQKEAEEKQKEEELAIQEKEQAEAEKAQKEAEEKQKEELAIQEKEQEEAEKEQNEDLATTSADDNAENIYRDSCAACHGGDLTGGAGLSLEGNGLSANEIEDIVENGQGGMPGGLVAGDDLTVLADWLSEQ